MEGWIKLHRVLMEKPIWTTSNCLQKALLVTLLLLANHKEHEWEWKGEKYRVKPGQFITSIDKLMDKIGKEATYEKIRTALKKFKKYGFLTDETTNKNRLITVVNWEEYQSSFDDDNNQNNNRITSTQQADNKQITTNNNNNNNKNYKKYISTRFDLFWKQYPNSSGKQSAIKAYEKKAVSEELEDLILNALSLQIGEWERLGTENKFIPHASTWLNQERFRDDFKKEMGGIEDPCMTFL